MNAWVDLFTRMDEAEPPTEVRVAYGETVTILLEDAEGLRSRAPEQYDAMVECSAFVNWRRIENGEPAYLCLAFA